MGIASGIIIRWIISNIVPISIVLVVLTLISTLAGLGGTAVSAISPVLAPGRGACEGSGDTDIQNEINKLPEDSTIKAKYQTDFDKAKETRKSNSSTNTSGMEGYVQPCAGLILGDGNATLPVEGGTLNEGYGETTWRTHSGIDIGGAFGSPIKAIVGGTVVGVVSSNADGNCQAYADADIILSCPYDGNYVKIRGSDGWMLLYYHLKYQSPTVKVGDNIPAGTVIGLLGNSGKSTGPHLHLGVFKPPSYTVSNPLDYLKAIGLQI